MVGVLEGSFFPLSKLGTKSPHTKFSGRGREDVDDFVQSRGQAQTVGRPSHFMVKRDLSSCAVSCRLRTEHRVTISWEFCFLGWIWRNSKAAS